MIILWLIGFLFTLGLCRTPKEGNWSDVIFWPIVLGEFVKDHLSRQFPE